MDDVFVLAVSSSRSDPIQHRKWRCLREMHTYSAPTTPPSRSSEIWWSGRWDRQHDSVVSMVESMRRQGFACLRGGRRTEKGGFRKRAVAPQELGRTKNRRLSTPFYRRPMRVRSRAAHETNTPRRRPLAIDRCDRIASERAVLCTMIGQAWPMWPTSAWPSWPGPSQPPPSSERAKQLSPGRLAHSKRAREALAAAPLFLFLLNK
jgi:hypothetical protein